MTLCLRLLWPQSGGCCNWSLRIWLRYHGHDGNFRYWSGSRGRLCYLLHNRSIFNQSRLTTLVQGNVEIGDGRSEISLAQPTCQDLSIVHAVIDARRVDEVNVVFNSTLLNDETLRVIQGGRQFCRRDSERGLNQLVACVCERFRVGQPFRDFETVLCGQFAGFELRDVLKLFCFGRNFFRSTDCLLAIHFAKLADKQVVRVDDLVELFLLCAIQDDLTASDGAVVLIRRLPFVSLFGHFVYDGCRGRNGCGCRDCCRSYFLNGNGGCHRIAWRIFQECVDLRSECGVKLHLLGVFRRRQVVDVEQCQCHRILLRNFCYDASSANACPSNSIGYGGF